MVTVSDGEILSAMVELGNVGGVFGEPAGVAALAGVRRALEEGIIQAGESVVHVVTGSGLKDVRAADRAAPAAQEVEANLAAVQKALLRATRNRAAHLAASGLPSFGASTHGGMRLPKKT
jgi:threonine synthase